MLLPSIGASLLPVNSEPTYHRTFGKYTGASDPDGLGRYPPCSMKPSVTDAFPFGKLFPDSIHQYPSSNVPRLYAHINRGADTFPLSDRVWTHMLADPC